MNYLLNTKALVLNGKNNYKHVIKQVVIVEYTNIFTSLKIVFSKIYQNNTFDI